jgi:hypothetical protein
MNRSKSSAAISHRLPQKSGAITQDRAERTARARACLMVLVLVIVLAAQATTSPQSAAPRGVGFAYDPAQEITMVGTVRGFASQPASGGLVGLHLLISNEGKVVDAHLGPFVSEENQHALHTGQLVQIIGVNENVHGKNVLLVRQLIFDGRLVTVRNERGLLVRDLVSHRAIHDGNPAANGGTR